MCKMSMAFFVTLEGKEVIKDQDSRGSQLEEATSDGDCLIINKDNMALD